MITLKEFMETVEYRITEGSEYGWKCFGDNAYSLSYWNGDHHGYSFNIVFDTEWQTVYQVEAFDYKRERAYRLMHPDCIEDYMDEAKERNVDPDEAWDSVRFVDLETKEDWMKKAQSIISGEDYDTRVDVPLTLDDNQLFELMKLAHERDITLNQLVEDVLRTAIEQYETVHVSNTDNPIDFPVPKKKKKGKK